MICYYFPPLGMGGTQRSAKFAKFLPEFGWQPTVVTVKPISYWATDQSLLSDLKKISVMRTESLDPQRLLYRFRPMQNTSEMAKSTKGHILKAVNQYILPFFLIPDSKILWSYHLYRAVRTLVQTEKFDALYTTSPPHSVHLLGKKIARHFGLKWIADFRDAWAGGVVVHEPTCVHRLVNRSMQKSVLKDADAVVAVTAGILNDLKSSPGKKFVHIPNGFDKDDFPVSIQKKPAQEKFVFCHCGSVTKFSNPESLLRAVKFLQPEELNRLCFEFIGYDATGDFKKRIAGTGLNCFRLQDYQPHSKALQTLMSADALVLVAHACAADQFIPGKLYEYFGSRKPILAITNIQDTIHLLKQYPNTIIVDPNHPELIVKAIRTMMTTHWPEIKKDISRQWSRREQTRQLAAVLNQITG
jgi:hypothetical protein